MVDRAARDKMAELVRQLVSGRMTNTEFEDRCGAIKFDKDDPAIYAAENAAYELYGDSYEQKLAGQYRVYGDTRRSVARLILFLQSNEEYEWPENSGSCLTFLVAAIVTFILASEFPGIALVAKSSIVVGFWIAYALIRFREVKRENEIGDKKVWPFLRQANSDEAVKHPRLLNGKR